ncbi:MAG: hypothetical protein WCT52_05330 [Candidatus Micrarchaeia archaeon]
MCASYKLPNQIYPTGRKTDYFTARQIAKEKNAFLPSNVLHDDILLRSDKWVQLQRKHDFYPAWANEISAHPKKGGVFARRQDIVDAQTGWTIPFFEANSCAINEFVGVPRVGLIITPKELTREGGRIIVHPESIIVFTKRIEVFGVPGQVDEKNRMPVESRLGSLSSQTKKNLDPLPNADLRWMYCFEGEAVRPLKRYVQDFRRGIFEISWNAPDIASVGLVYPVSSD